MPHGFDPNYNFDLERMRSAARSTIPTAHLVSVPDQLRALGCSINDTLGTATGFTKVSLGTAVAMESSWCEDPRDPDVRERWSIRMKPKVYPPYGPDGYSTIVFPVVEVEDVTRYRRVVTNPWAD
jgi:hypothetical protein